jgi:hypothetical protein
MPRYYFQAMGIGAWVETWLDKHRNEALEKRDRELKEAERNKFNEENVRKIQLEFEWRLEETIYWREAYIYRHLMSKWFSGLIEKYRYDKSRSNKIRSDWLSYMSLLKQAGSLSFLSLHSSNEDKRNSYKQRKLEERKTYMATEEAFAAQIGKKAVETLQRVRESEHDAFDRSGKEIIAPNGYHYFCVSFDPYKEELRPREFTASPPTPK